MRLGAVGDLITHAGLERKAPAVRKFGVELAGKAQQEVAFRAPMIGPVAWGIFDHPHPDVAELPGAPARGATLAGVDGLRNVRPIGGPKRNIADLPVPLTCRCL